MKTGNVNKLIVSLIAAVTLLVLLNGAALAAVDIFAYWVTGYVADVQRQGETTIRADGRRVVFCTSEAAYRTGHYAEARIVDNRFMINAFNVWPEQLEVGGAYKVNVIREEGGDNWGASGEVTVSGVGWDEVQGLTLTPGGGLSDNPTPPPVIEPAPTFQVRFGNRLYQKNLYWIPEKGNKPFVISSRPNIQVDVFIEPPYTLADIQNMTIILDEGTAQSKVLNLGAANVTGKTYAADSTPFAEKIKSMTVSYSFDEAIPDGKHIFNLSARSSGLIGQATTGTDAATVEVMGGPTRIIGVPITYPSPFNMNKDREVTIQYELSSDCNIMVAINSPTGEFAKKWMFNTGTEGGSAGINKVTWDGKTDAGYQAGNAIYLGSIISRDDNRLLGKVKLTILN